MAAQLIQVATYIDRKLKRLMLKDMQGVNSRLSVSAYLEKLLREHLEKKYGKKAA